MFNRTVGAGRLTFEQAVERVGRLTFAALLVQFGHFIRTLGDILNIIRNLADIAHNTIDNATGRTNHIVDIAADLTGCLNDARQTVALGIFNSVTNILGSIFNRFNAVFNLVDSCFSRFGSINRLFTGCRNIFNTAGEIAPSAGTFRFTAETANIFFRLRTCHFGRNLAVNAGGSRSRINCGRFNPFIFGIGKTFVKVIAIRQLIVAQPPLRKDKIFYETSHIGNQKQTDCNIGKPFPADFVENSHEGKTNQAKTCKYVDNRFKAD